MTLKNSHNSGAAVEATPVTTDPLQYFTFRLAGEEYAVPILRVREIIEYDTLTKVPKTPPAVRGVINLRGSVVPVVDLAVKFGLPERPVTKRTCIVIVEVELDGDPAVMGILVDAVHQVIDLPPQEIEAPPALGTRVRVDYLKGMGKVGKKFLLILDVDRVLSAQELMAAPLRAAAAETEETSTAEARSETKGAPSKDSQP